jgi:SAM-dependent methyltransferase
MHGTTLHGWQNADARDTCTPTSYYHPSGPAGQLFDTVGAHADRVGVVGLGPGELVCYGRPGARWTFFEIDPAVERIARNPAFFTFLTNARAAVDVVIGDGRLTLARTEPGTFDVILIDAFSSDAIPIHLLTREFLATALDRLRPGGVLAFHISNLYLRLEPVVGASVQSLGGSALFQYFRSTSPDGSDSEWLLAARSPTDLAAFASDPRWRPARVGKSWTDDHSNIFDAIRW